MKNILKKKLYNFIKPFEHRLHETKVRRFKQFTSFGFLLAVPTPVYLWIVLTDFAPMPIKNGLSYVIAPWTIVIVFLKLLIQLEKWLGF